MATTKTGLASIQQGRSDIFRINPTDLYIRTDWNSRDFNDPDNIEHIEMLALSIAEKGVIEPIKVNWEGGKAWVVNGECRLRGALLAIKRGAPVKTVPVISDERYANEADRIFTQYLGNTGKPFTQLETAKNWKRLIDLGWTQQDIAKKAGLTGGRVSQILNLLTLPTGVQNMVVAQQVSPAMAVQTVKAADGDGTAAEAALKAGLAAAQAEGKTKIKPSHMPATVGEKPINFRAAVTEAFESANIDDSDEQVVVVKFPVDKWSVIAKLLEL